MTLDMKLQEIREEGAIEATIETARDFDDSDANIIQRLMSDFDLTKDEAEEKLSEHDSHSK